MLLFCRYQIKSFSLRSFTSTLVRSVSVLVFPFFFFLYVIYVPKYLQKLTINKFHFDNISILYIYRIYVRIIDVP